MARSHAVWVVTSELVSWPLAAFTVKHELTTWLEYQPQPILVWVHVWRCENPVFNSGGRDHFHGETQIPVEVPIDDLIGCADDPGFLCIHYGSLTNESATSEPLCLILFLPSLKPRSGLGVALLQ